MHADKFKLLIIDDEKNILRTLEDRLEDEYDVTVALSGEIAFELMLADPSQFKLILCDEKMPGISGHEFARKVHEDKRFEHVYVIIHSGVISVIEIQKALNKGNIFGLLNKPADDAELFSLLKAACKNIELERMAHDDGLTELKNRRYTEAALLTEIKRAQRSKAPFILVLFDIDHFKHVNDKFGHDVGDQVLKSIGQLIKKTIRQTDIAGRWGGEEFVLILSDTSKSNGQNLAEKLRQRIANHDFPTAGKITISLGVTPCLPGDGEVITEIYKRADLALYQAKEGGRNRVCVLPEPQVLPTAFITYIRLRNIRCFKELEFDLSTAKETSLRHLFLGNNAVGKSTVLRSIALGLCDEMRAVPLMKELPGTFIREGETFGTITLRLDHPNGKKLEIITEIENREGTERLRKKTEPEPFPWNSIFVCGYGPQRSTLATNSFEQYEVDQAVRSLFNYTTSLQNPELIWLRQDVWMRKILNDTLLKMLMLDEDHSISHSREGVRLNGPLGSHAHHVLSDGYRSTIQWLVDFMGCAIYAKRMTKDRPLTGIVLIDELEQHLHPRWQRKIIRLLKAQFPHVQFFVSAHSPIIATSFASSEANATEHERDVVYELKATGQNHVEALRVANEKLLA